MPPTRGLVCLLGLALAAGAGLASTATAADDPEPIVLFEDQRTSGDLVLVDLVQFPDGGFVVLHEPGPEGRLGPVAGASTLLSAGLHENVPVVLYEDLNASATLVATLYEDTNGNRALDIQDGHQHQGHEHRAEDEPYTDGERPIGDEAAVDPYDEGEPSQTSADPLLVGAATAAAALGLWAVRYR